MRPAIRPRLAPALVALATPIGIALIAPEPALSHGLTVGRRDLPIPDWLFAWGASVVLIVSFVALTVAWHTTRFENGRWRPAPARLARLVVNRWTEGLAAILGIFLFAVTIWAGLTGTEALDRNFAPTFVFVTAWLGLVVASVLLGDAFRALNPWRALARIARGGLRLLTGQEPRSLLRYPERLGRWPAVAGLIAFVWLELIYGVAFGATALTAHTTAVAILVYSAYTFVAMALFGVERWLDRGEAFSVYFNMFSQLAALEVRGGRLGFRRPLAAAASWAKVAGSVPLVLIAIGLTAFDGAQEGALEEPITTLFDGAIDAGLGTLAAFRLSNTIFLILVLAAVAGIYWLGILGMHTVRASLSTRGLGQAFAHSFIPIALAYLVAHYFSLFLFQEQAQFTYLLSDPRGDGSDYFGTADSGIDYGLIGATAIWYVQVGALVAGHVTALALGHDRALSIHGDSRAAARSQYWMLAMMVGFTTLGLYLLSQANA